MKISISTIAILALATDYAGAFSFTAPSIAKAGVASSSRLNMVLEKPKATSKVKKISKLEVLKTESANLVHPLKEVSFLSSIDVSRLVSYLSEVAAITLWGTD